MNHTALSHVLYVDDEPDMRMLVQLALENAGGIRVTLCENAIDTLAAALDHKPQMIILDAMMPGMDGPAILNEIKKDSRINQIPVVFLTAKTAPEAVEAFKALGAAGVIAKPFNLITLSDQLKSLWQQNAA